jgi:RNA polymerase sigma factor (sigma-70 family)
MIRYRDEIRRLFSEGSVAGLSDFQLLERFVSRGDGEAFAAIVARHGVMVLAACRTGLGTFDGAEDAFQATFLVLARRAGSFPFQGSLAGWLYRVARRVSRQARIEATRRVARERKSAIRSEAGPTFDPASEEIHRLIHEELAHLPERHREVIQLCDLHGLTRDEAAQAIGCPPGTVAGRLARARDQLKGRLTRRGVTAPSAWPLGLLGGGSKLFHETTQAAIQAGRGEGVASVATTLAATASRNLFLARIPVNLALLTALVATGAATAMLAFRPESEPPRELPPLRITPVMAPVQAPKPIDLDDPTTADLFAGRVVDSDGQPVPGAKLYVVPLDLSRTDADTAQVRAVTTADGRFRFSAKDMTFIALDGLPARRPGRLIAKADGYGPDVVWTPGPAWWDSSLLINMVKGDEWTLTLARGDVPICGRLLDPKGQPLAGATITLKDLNVPLGRNLDDYLGTINIPNRSPPGFARSMDQLDLVPELADRAVTGADGRFRIEGLGRDRIARLAIKGPGIADMSIEVMTRDDLDFRVGGPDAGINAYFIYGANFTLETRPGLSVKGRVLEQETRRPLADVLVTSNMSFGIAWTTDAEGRFVLEGLPLDGRWPDVMAIPKPGQPYWQAKVVLNREGETVVNCTKGLPYRLMIRDEQGRPVEAEVGYSIIQPNELVRRLYNDVQQVVWTPASKAARQADGSYLGVALPGPGVVMAKTTARAGFRPAHVDPKGFFAPGRKQWTAQELITTYGTDDTLSVATRSGPVWEDQNEYAAIVLINPAEGSKPLELEATVVRDRPRQITLIDPEGRPVIGAKARGLIYYDHDRGGSETTLRSATFPVTGLHPDRARRILFFKEDRKLIGFLLARGDGDSPYTVRMQRWGVVTGRIVDEQGQPMNLASGPGNAFRDAGLSGNSWHEIATFNDPAFGKMNYPNLEDDGRFRIEKLVPGQAYRADVWGSHRQSKIAFEGLKLAPGEVRDLGDIRIGPAGEPVKSGVIP